MSIKVSGRCIWTFTDNVLVFRGLMYIQHITGLRLCAI